MLNNLEQQARANAGNTHAWLAYAQAAAQQNEWIRAEQAFAHLYSLQPTHAAIARNWLRAKERLGQTLEAIHIAARWLDRFPDDVLMWKRVVSLAQVGKHFDTEESAHRNLARLEPHDPAHVFHHACAISSLNRFDDAREVIDRGLQRWPDDLRLRWFGVASMRALPRDDAQIGEERASAQRALAQIERWQGDATLAHDAVRRSTFYFAYDGQNDTMRAFATGRQMARLAQACLAQSSIDALRISPAAKAKTPGKLRIGFVSTLWHRHTVSKYFGGWIKHIDRTRFETLLVHDGPTRDDVTKALEASVDHVARPADNQTLAQLLASLSLDVIIYADIGMVARHIPLYAYRFAPLQLAAWGHPITTGYPEIDGFITVAAMEPPDARAHYTERELIQLPGIGIAMDVPTDVPEKADSTWRKAANIRADAHVLLCPQALFKIHHEDDQRFARVLAETTMHNTHLVFFEAKEPSITPLFQTRFARALEANAVDASRVTIVSLQSYANFLNIVSDASVVLDTHHFSGGSTSLDALACGTPIVTWPGEFMRGRQTAGMLTLAGLQDDVVYGTQDYIARVQHHLQTNAAQRDAVRAQRRHAAKTLWNDVSTVRALEAEISKHF
jgi:protein O-GlcNAc transferase